MAIIGFLLLVGTAPLWIPVALFGAWICLEVVLLPITLPLVVLGKLVGVKPVEKEKT